VRDVGLFFAFQAQVESFKAGTVLSIAYLDVRLEVFFAFRLSFFFIGPKNDVEDGNVAFVDDDSVGKVS
jgi:hypothetical protein